MITKRRIMAVSLAALIGLGITPMLTACNPGQVVADAAQKAVKDATGVDVNVDGGGNSLPSNWPAAVPIIAGKISAAGSVSANGGTTWTATVGVSDLKSAYESAKAKLASAGFKTDSDTALEGNYIGNLSNGTYNVIISAVDTAGTKTVTYAVTAAK